MFGIQFMKASPTDYVLQYQNGVVKREGPGLTFFYFAPMSTVAAIPLASVDIPFVFHETTIDFQEVTIQGQLTYRVIDPRRLASLLDFSIDQNGKYISDDPQSLAKRLVNVTQVLARAIIQTMLLREALTGSEALVKLVLAELKSAIVVQMHGIEALGMSLLSIKPTPEMSRALEAAAREGLQREADEAIYGRRNAAVEHERRIKESELNTEIAVEEKRRQIRETQMAADIAIEEQRSTLIDERIVNDRKDAESRSYALEATLKPLRATDWRTIMAATTSGVDARGTIALAFHELAENASRIGQLNVTPDLLKTLLTSPGK